MPDYFIIRPTTGPASPFRSGFTVNSVPSSEIAVIVVNYNTAALTLDAVESVLARSHGGRSVELHVVDNASPNGDASILSAALAERGWTPRVHLHSEAQNHGFGRGNNVVLTELMGRPVPPAYAFLLNPDARLDNEAVGVLADFLDAHPAAAAAGAGIVSPEGVPATSAFRFPGVVSTFASALCLGPVSRLLGAWDVSLPPATGTQRVDWVSGAAVMLRLSAVQRVGYFDPSYFLYFEEVDLMRQLTREGGEVWHVDEARVAHIEGAATGVRGDNTRRLPAYWYHSWQHYFDKNRGRGTALLAAAAWYTGAAGNAIIASLRGRQAHAPKRFYGDFWRLSIRPLLGLRPSPLD